MSRLSLVLLAALTLAGCNSVSTIARRMQEKSAAVASATPRQQRQMRHGFIAPDFTPDMVYVALDRPDRVIQKPADHIERWVYYNFSRRPVKYTLDPARAGDPSYLAATHGGPLDAPGGNALGADLIKSADTATRHLVVTFFNGKVADIALLQR